MPNCFFTNDDENTFLRRFTSILARNPDIGYRSPRKQFPICPINFADTAADTHGWEKEIDRCVYRLDGLTQDEIKPVKESVKR
jgi:hypothetical protein